jgi:hypothetical protein
MTAASAHSTTERNGLLAGPPGLERCGVIRPPDPKITVTDREGLLGLTNGSYGIPESEMKRLIS